VIRGTGGGDTCPAAWEVHQPEYTVDRIVKLIMEVERRDI
jgi:hypothetical protein